MFNQNGKGIYQQLSSSIKPQADINKERKISSIIPSLSPHIKQGFLSGIVMLCLVPAPIFLQK